MSRALRAAAFALLATSPADRAHAQDADRWYTIRMGGVPVGWMHDVRVASDSGVRVLTHMRLTFNRMGSQVVMDLSERSLEDRRGLLVRSDAMTRMSTQATQLHAVMMGDSVRIETSAGGREFVRAIPIRPPVLGSAAVDRMTCDSLLQAGDSLVVQTFSGMQGAPATVTRVLVRMDTLTVTGSRVTARRVVERSSASPVPVTYWMNTHGTILRSAYDSPFGRTESQLADSATAMAAASGARLADEQYARTLVPTRVKLPQARRLTMLRLALGRGDTSFAWPDLEGDGQHVLERTSREVVLEVTRREPPPGPHPFPVPPAAASRPYLAPNAYVQSDDPHARALARRIVGRETDAWRATLALKRWVADSMHFDLGIAFAPSTEVLARRRGTCVAYATLLATLARAVGIPSRVAFGFAYVNGMLGGHAWTEVLLGDRWVPADAALVGPGAADAARFAFTHGSLAGGPAELTGSPGGRLYGAITARVLAYRVKNDRMVTLDTLAAPYVITGDTYRNPALDLTLTRPNGFSFTELDEIWPSHTIVAMSDASGDTVRVSSYSRLPWVAPDGDARARAATVLPSGHSRPLSLRDRTGWARTEGRRAVIALPAGGETLLVLSRGSGALQLAEDVATSLLLAP